MDKRKMKQYIIIAVIIIILLLLWIVGKKAIKKLEKVYSPEVEQPQIPIAYEQPPLVEKSKDEYIIIEEKKEEK